MKCPTIKYPNLKCKVCENSTFAEGSLNGYGGMGFIPKGRKSIFSAIHVYALACTHCGHLELFTDKDKLPKFK